MAVNKWRVPSRPCPFYSQGRCLFSDACNFVHEAKVKAQLDPIFKQRNRVAPPPPPPESEIDDELPTPANIYDDPTITITNAAALRDRQNEPAPAREPNKGHHAEAPHYTPELQETLPEATPLLSSIPTQDQAPRRRSTESNVSLLSNLSPVFSPPLVSFGSHRSVDSGYGEDWVGPAPFMFSPTRSPAPSSTLDLLASPFRPPSSFLPQFDNSVFTRTSLMAAKESPASEPQIPDDNGLLLRLDHSNSLHDEQGLVDDNASILSESQSPRVDPQPVYPERSPSLGDGDALNTLYHSYSHVSSSSKSSPASAPGSTPIFLPPEPGTVIVEPREVDPPSPELEADEPEQADSSSDSEIDSPEPQDATPLEPIIERPGSRVFSRPVSMASTGSIRSRHTDRPASGFVLPGPSQSGSPVFGSVSSKPSPAPSSLVFEAGSVQSSPQSDDLDVLAYQNPSPQSQRASVSSHRSVRPQSVGADVLAYENASPQSEEAGFLAYQDVSPQSEESRGLAYDMESPQSLASGSSVHEMDHIQPAEPTVLDREMDNSQSPEVNGLTALPDTVPLLESGDLAHAMGHVQSPEPSNLDREMEGSQPPDVGGQTQRSDSPRSPVQSGSVVQSPGSTGLDREMVSPQSPEVGNLAHQSDSPQFFGFEGIDASVHEEDLPQSPKTDASSIKGEHSPAPEVHDQVELVGSPISHVFSHPAPELGDQASRPSSRPPSGVSVVESRRDSIPVAESPEQEPSHVDEVLVGPQPEVPFNFGPGPSTTRIKHSSLMLKRYSKLAESNRASSLPASTPGSPSSPAPVLESKLRPLRLSIIVDPTAPLQSPLVYDTFAHEFTDKSNRPSSSNTVTPPIQTSYSESLNASNRQSLALNGKQLNGMSLAASDAPRSAPLSRPVSWRQSVHRTSQFLSHSRQPSLRPSPPLIEEPENPGPALQEHDTHDQTVRIPLQEPPRSAPPLQAPSALLSAPPAETPKPLLAFAIASDDVDEVVKVLKQGDANANDNVGPQSALDFVLTNDQLTNKLDMVKTLLAYGATPSASQGNGENLDPATKYHLKRAAAEQTQKASALIQKSFFRPLTRVRYDIIGQDMVLEQLFRVLNIHSKKLTVSPIVVFLCGPSGHGKSYLAQKFGSLVDVSTHTVNMTAIRSTQALWGAYSLSDDQDLSSPLTLGEFLVANQGKRCVVVLEEIEKTEDEKSLWSLLMPWESGRCLLEPGGRPIDVRNVVWICTSNLGSEHIFENDESRANRDVPVTREEYSALTGQLRTLVSAQLGASLLSRVTAVLPFIPFTRDERMAITAEAFYTLGAEVVQEKPAKEFEKIVESILPAYVPTEGARSLYRAVSSFLLDNM